MSNYDFFQTEPVHGPTHRPQSIDEVDVRQAILEDLALKILYMSGSLSVLQLSEKTRLSFEVAKELAFQLRTELLCQVTGMHGHVPQIAITSEGRSRAADLLTQNLYTGPAPVALASYVDQVRL